MATIQQLFGRHNISSVQAHTGPEAAASAQAMGAQAYASGDHVVLGPHADLHTVAHEAAHVVQQRGGVQLKGGVGEVGDRYEQHADVVADAVVQGKSVESLLGQMAPGAGGATAAGAGPVQRVVTKSESGGRKPYSSSKDPQTKFATREEAELHEQSLKRMRQPGERARAPGPSDLTATSTSTHDAPPSPGRAPSPVDPFASDDERMEQDVPENILPPGTKVEVNDDGIMEGTIVSFENGMYLVQIDRDMEGKATSDWSERYRHTKVKPAATGPKPIKRVPPDGVKISHFHSRGVTGSEYIKPGGKIDVTQHGHGSGIYGIANPTSAHQEQAINFNASAVAEEITVKNPFYLQDKQHSDQFKTVSKNLQRATTEAAELVNTERIPIREAIARASGSIDAVAQSLDKLIERVGKEPPGVSWLKERIEAFLTVYFAASQPMMRQPINFVLGPLGYDGLFSDEADDNTWSVGMVAFSPHDDHYPHRATEDRMTEKK
ncbi:MAG TPA: DUF4157 domain-containing protein [Kofleriaceae bacterium]|nr:DUF4157 domain-containing protein [Kofleriaceae bacterium]